MKAILLLSLLALTSLIIAEDHQFGSYPSTYDGFGNVGPYGSYGIGYGGYGGYGAYGEYPGAYGFGIETGLKGQQQIQQIET